MFQEIRPDFEGGFWSDSAVFNLRGAAVTLPRRSYTIGDNMATMPGTDNNTSSGVNNSNTGKKTEQNNTSRSISKSMNGKRKAVCKDAEIKDLFKKFDDENIKNSVKYFKNIGKGSTSDGLEDWGNIVESLKIRQALIFSAANGLQNSYESADVNYLSLAATDVFVEKAQRKLTDRAIE